MNNYLPEIDVSVAQETDSTQLKTLATQAVQSVSPMLLAGFRAPMAKDFKRDRHDLVTEYDRESEKRIVESLIINGPACTIVGEEGGTSGGAELEWHIDPIDGTSNFARGLPLWCISIAAVRNNVTQAGVILEPVTGNLFAADSSGATLNGKPIRVNAATDELDATIVSSFPNAKDTWLFGHRALDAQGSLLDSFQAVRNLGSGALNLAYVAAGFADATMGFLTNSWDISAGRFILQQAGGRFYPVTYGEAFQPGHLTADYFAIGGAQEYPTLQRVVTELSASYSRRALPAK